MKPLLSVEKLVELRNRLKQAGKTVVFTNGCFDLLHRGHVEYLQGARNLGDVLFVGLNDDTSILLQKKGPERPIFPLEDRAAILMALESVDYVCPFSEDTPERLIAQLKPDILVKGGDYSLDQIVGRHLVEEAGGRVIVLPLLKGRSTSATVCRILRAYNLETGRE
ncbi:MAG: D-glycero-beta-D-manno-heptose 1-phosphate adenylyltransferase [Candidatus Latescibacterota bacterium]